MASIIWDAYEKNQMLLPCPWKTHDHQQKLGVKEGRRLSPLLVSVVYELSHATPRAEFPSVRLFIYMGCFRCPR